MISRYQAKVSDSKLTVKFKHAKKICGEAFKALNVNSDKSFEMSVDTLEAVAKGRYVLKLVADYVLICFIEGDSSYTRDLDAQRELMLLLESARRFCGLRGRRKKGRERGREKSTATQASLLRDTVLEI